MEAEKQKKKNVAGGSVLWCSQHETIQSARRLTVRGGSMACSPCDTDTVLSVQASRYHVHPHVCFLWILVYHNLRHLHTLTLHDSMLPRQSHVLNHPLSWFVFQKDSIQDHYSRLHMFELWTSSDILKTKSNTRFRELDLFPNPDKCVGSAAHLAVRHTETRMEIQFQDVCSRNFSGFVIRNVEILPSLNIRRHKDEECHGLYIGNRKFGFSCERKWK